MKTIHSVDDLSEILRKSDIYSRFRLSRLGIFGSFARGEESNDIDFLVEDPITLDEALELKLALEELICTRVDIVLSQFANPIVLHRAHKDIRYVEIN